MFKAQHNEYCSKCYDCNFSFNHETDSIEKYKTDIIEKNGVVVLRGRANDHVWGGGVSVEVVFF